MSKNYLIMKTIRLVISLLLFSFLLYLFLYLSTGDPALGVLRKMGIQTVNNQLVKNTRAELGIDGSFLEQYTHWLSKVMKGDFGQSFMNSQPVTALIIERIMVTQRLIFYSFFCCISVALCIGSILSNMKNRRLRNLFENFFALTLSFPIYWIAILLIFIFGVQLAWFPFVGSETEKHLILPIIAIVSSEGFYLIKMTSQLLKPIVDSERHMLARFRGIRWYYRIGYQWKEAAVSLITLYGNSFLHLFGICVMVEIIFSISGIGKLLMDSIMSRDYPVIQGITLLIAAVTFSFNYLMDLLITKIDRRIELNQRRPK